jgi:hypothetical protein
MFKIIIVSLYLTDFAHPSDLEIVQEIPKIGNGPNINYQNSCTNCIKPLNTLNLSIAIFDSPSNNQKVEISVITLEKAQALFVKLENSKEIPFAFGKDGCFARAHKMAILLDEEKVITGKAFMQGRFYSQTINGPAFWTYHVAPMILVKNGEVVIPYIFDPSMFHQAIPLSEWKKGLGRSTRSAFLEEYYTNRFSYDLNDKDKVYDKYSEASIKSMNDENNKNLDILSKMQPN